MTAADDVLELPTWQRIRRYAVPRTMIEECAAHRAAGDWRASCQAARIDVGFDLAKVSARYGSAAAERIEGELTGLAADLLRWQLPRSLGGRTSLRTHLSAVLSPRLDRLDADTPVLCVQLPKAVDGSQRLRLDVVTLVEDSAWERADLAGHLWDTERLGDLRRDYGGSVDRLPRFDPSGAALPVAAFADQPAPDDPAAHAEHIRGLIARDEVIAAWQAAGMRLDPIVPKRTWRTPTMEALGAQPLDLLKVAREARRLGALLGVGSVVLDTCQVHIDVSEPDQLRAKMSADYSRLYKSTRIVGQLCHSPDLELLWRGLITPEELHPLVRHALFPASTAAPPREEIAVSTRPTDLPALDPVMVRCRGEWHRLEHRDGGLVPAHHSPEEVQREQLMHTLGGAVSGCFQVRLIWRGTPGRLPRRLHRQRREIMQHVLHGRIDTVLALLDAGLDPRLRDGRGHSLLHLLRALDHEVLLPRLLAAGLDINLRDHRQRTPLHVAVGDVGTPELVLALLAAGADPHAKDQNGTTPLELGEYKSYSYQDDDDEEQVDSDRPTAVIHRYLTERARR